MFVEYGIEIYCEKGYIGVWIVVSNNKFKWKICVIGVYLSCWVSMYGFVFNVNFSLDYFNNVIFCGIDDKDKDVMSMVEEFQCLVDIEEVKNKLKVYYVEFFNF